MKSHWLSHTISYLTLQSLVSFTTSFIPHAALRTSHYSSSSTFTFTFTSTSTSTAINKRMRFGIPSNNSILPKANRCSNTIVSFAALFSNNDNDASSLSSSSSSSSSNQSQTVGIIGRGFISILTAKLSALAGYQTWMFYPPNELEKIQSLIQNDNDYDMVGIPSTLEFVSIADADEIISKMQNTNGLIFACDEPETGVFDSNVIDFLIQNSQKDILKRVVIMSRTLNGKGMGFIAKAAKLSANKDIWAGDATAIQRYKSYEQTIRESISQMESNADIMVIRAGTLKGGGCGEDGAAAADADADNNDKSPVAQLFPQYLSSKFYELVKNDIIAWQFLFDCNVRGVKLYKGDTMPGPGGKAILTATASEACDGDSSRCAVAEALVRSLSLDCSGDHQDGGGEFCVGTAKSRIPPTDAEWDQMLKRVMT